MPKVKSVGTEGTKTTRKRKNAKKEEEETKQEEHIVVQLPIQPERIQNLLDETNEIINPLEYCPRIVDPEPYIPTNNFMSHNDVVAQFNGTGIEDSQEALIKEVIQDELVKEKDLQKTIRNCCYWCCHTMGAKEFGLPIKYDTVHKTFTTYGYFCSLECVVAYNYSHYMGSDRMWEIHSWIQWMAQKMGYDTPIRPAPSRYLLKMFNGPLEIEEFRGAHKKYLKTYVMNMPPLIHVQGQMEMINTSYLNQKTNITTVSSEPMEKIKLSRKKAVMDIKKTLDAKMNLTVKSIQEVEVATS
jgi:hypothetical protein